MSDGIDGALQPSELALARRYDVALLDLDGVVYVGPTAVPHAATALEQAAGLGMGLAFVTNNASRTPDSIAEHLRELDIPVRAEQVITSAQAAARVMTGLVPPGAKVLVVGGAGLHAALTERGLVPVTSADDDPQAVIQGYSPDLGWRELAEGAYALHRGIPWVASNTDITIPTPRGRAPGNGTLVQVLRMATQREPVVAGKPQPPMHREAMIRTNAQHPLVVGDRLDTDIEAAVAAEVDSLLVFSGVTGAVELLAAPPNHRPTYIAHDVRGLLHEQPSLHPAGSGWRCGAATVDVSSGEWSISVATPIAADTATSIATGDGFGDDGLDLLRAACAAVWTASTSAQHELIAQVPRAVVDSVRPPA